MRGVVVTGLGMVSALGLNRNECFFALQNGRSGIGVASPEIRALFPYALSASLPAGFDALVEKPEAGFDRATKAGLVAAREALADAEFDVPVEERCRVGVYVGVGMGGTCTLNDIYAKFFDRMFNVEHGDPKVTHPLSVPRTMANSTAAWISIHNGFRGPTHTYSVACSSSAVAIGEAYRAIKHGYADAILVVGTEAMLVPGAYVAWNMMRVMATPDKDDPGASCKPFSKGRSGFILGEGAAALLLESDESANRRGKTAYGKIIGYGCASDATHITTPSKEGQMAAMNLALEDSGRPLEEIDYINAHGTATVVGDVIETESIKSIFGAHAKKLAISSTKAMHGHLIGGAGALEFGISLMAMKTGVIPPTANLTESDPECDLDYVPCQARSGQKLHTVMSNSFAFGGTNACLVASVE
ncbi:beta-ketoacyl-[acyl-carrier-protein] synthase family protein [Herbaspirillum sp. HC18]|nr:beta-ketoacyl-[acyl-carrier-protein] synthase family protein [Herbaspirillum sp. HC18]